MVQSQHMTAPPMTRTQRIITQALEHNGHPPLAAYVRRGRRLGHSWADIAANVELDSGEPCHRSSLKRWFGQQFPPTTPKRDR